MSAPRNVAVVLEARPGSLTPRPLQNVRRFRTVRQARRWLAGLKSPRARKALHDGFYSVEKVQ